MTNCGCNGHVTSPLLTIIGEITFCLLATVAVTNGEQSDIQAISFGDAPGHSDYGLGDGDDVKELTFQVGEKEQKAVVKKSSMFNDDVLLETCGKTGCKSDKLSDKIKERISNCSFVGNLIGDKDSRVAVSKCGGPGLDLSIITDSKTVKGNSYRMDAKGNIKRALIENFLEDTAPLKHARDLASSVIKKSVDKLIKGKMFMDKAGSMFEVENDATSEGRDYLVKEQCCRAIKRSCRKMDNRRLRCSVWKGPKKCGEQCTRMRRVLKLNAKSQLNKIEKHFNASKSKKTTQPQPETSSSEEKQEKGTTERPAKPTTTARHGSDVHKYSESKKDEEPKEEDDDDVFGDEEYNDKEDEESDNVEIDPKKELKDFTVDELKKIHDRTGKDSSGGKGGDDPFRSSQVLKKECQGCTQKSPNPTKNLYSEMTVEVCVVTDLFLFNKLQKNMKSGDKNKVRDQMIELVHGVMIATETFLSHPGISSKGGFKIKINGLKILQDMGDKMTRDIQTKTNTNDQLESFRKFAESVNNPNDGEVGSYDMMILLTGKDLEDVPQYTSKGLAYTGQVCSMGPACLLTLGLDGVKHIPTAGQLLAHELGHLLGSDHDGAMPVNPYSIYYNKGPVPCPQGTIMSPTVTEEMRTWSECTRKMVDAEYDRRQKDNPKAGNCFLT